MYCKKFWNSFSIHCTYTVLSYINVRSEEKKLSNSLKFKDQLTYSSLIQVWTILKLLTVDHQTGQTSVTSISAVKWVGVWGGDSISHDPDRSHSIRSGMLCVEYDVMHRAKADVLLK